MSAINTYWCEQCRKRHREDQSLYLDHLGFQSGIPEEAGVLESDVFEDPRKKMERLRPPKGFTMKADDLEWAKQMVYAANARKLGKHFIATLYKGKVFVLRDK